MPNLCGFIWNLLCCQYGNSYFSVLVENEIGIWAKFYSESHEFDGASWVQGPYILYESFLLLVFKKN